jgi:hypothetical protein
MSCRASDETEQTTFCPFTVASKLMPKVSGLTAYLPLNEMFIVLLWFVVPNIN